MKNSSAPASFALRVRLRMRGHRSVARSLAPYRPVGWCGMAQRAGEEPYCAFGGQAVLDGAAVSRDTIFRIASISKTVGAAAAMRLVARGKLSLDGDIADVLGFSAGRPITLRQLLTHTAALDDRPVYDRVIGSANPPPLDELLPKSFLSYAPGTRFRYSNLGAGVAGMLVEAASGMLFDDFVRQELFDPYGIDASFHPQRIVSKDRMANCYRVPGRKLSYDAHAIAASPMDEVSNPRMHYAIPAGKLMISASNLLWLLQMIYAEQKELFVRQDHIGSVTCDAGRGLGVAWAGEGTFARDRAFWGHQGSAYGALSQAWIDPKDGTAAVLLTNGAVHSGLGSLYMAGQAGIAALLDQVAGHGVY